MMRVTAPEITTLTNDTANDRYTITNTITQVDVTLTGLKTWMDGGLTHDTAGEITLVVTRTDGSGNTETLTEGLDYSITWSDKSASISQYVISGYNGSVLPKYDVNGYEYTYMVTEAPDVAGGDTITVEIGGVDYVYTISESYSTTERIYNITNTRVSDPPKDPIKVVSAASAAGISGADVSVGDEVTYEIGYYNNNNYSANVVIVDVLDEGVDFVSATTPDGTIVDYATAVNAAAGSSVVYDSTNHTVTWTLSASMFEKGTVSLTVKVNNLANKIETGETSASISNTASVNIGNVGAVDTGTVTNNIKTGSLSLTKEVSADTTVDTSGMTFTFIVTAENDEFDGLTTVLDEDGTSYSISTDSNGKKYISVSVGTISSVTLVNLPLGSYVVTEYGETTLGNETTTSTTYNLKTYEWTVTDSGKTVDVDAASSSTPVEATIINTLTGTVNPVFTKIWTDNSDRYQLRTGGIEITLTAVGGDGRTYTYTFNVSGSGDTWVESLSEIEMYDSDGNKLTYTVTETSVNGYTTNYTSGASYTPADDENLTITNTLQMGNVTVSKVVKDADGNAVTSTENTDRFNFVLYTEESGVITEYASGELQAGETITFSDIPIGTYYLTEELETSNEHTYSTTVEVDNGTVTTPIIDEGFNSTKGVKTRTVEITVTDGGTVRVEFTNQEEELEASLSSLLNGTKLLTTDDNNTTTMDFEFTVYDSTDSPVATGVAQNVTAINESAVQSGDETDITWTVTDTDAFTYTKTGTYTYTIKENTATEDGVTYDITEYTLIIVVSRDEASGELIAIASMNDSDGNKVYSNVGSETINVTSGFSFTASFVNEYEYTEIPEPIVTPEPTEEPTVTPEPTEEPTVTPEPTAEPTVTPEPTDEPTVTPEPTEEPTPTPEPTDEPTPKPEPTDEPTPTPEPTDEPTPTPEPTDEPTPTPEPTVDPTVTPEPTDDPTPTPEPTDDPTPTAEPTDEPTATPTPTGEPTEEPTVTPTPTAEPTEEPTATPTPTAEPTEEPTVTPTETPTPTAEPTEEPTATPTPSAEAGTSSDTDTKPDSVTESDEEFGTGTDSDTDTDTDTDTGMDYSETSSGIDTEVDAAENTATGTGDSSPLAGYICMILLSWGALMMEETFGRKRKRKE